MGEVFNKQLWGNLRGNVWDTLKREAINMPNMEKAQLAADVAGVFDPTPASDTVGAALSIVRGDWWGAGASVLGYIPYVGDLAKIGKVAKYAPKTADMLKMFMKGSDDLARAGADKLAKYFTPQQVLDAKRKAAEAVRDAMRKKRAKDPNCKECKKIKMGNRMPKKGGKWKDENGNPLSSPPGDGNGVFKLDQPRKLPDGSTVDEIKFKEGFPDFSEYTYGGKNKFYDIDGMTGDVGKDALLLEKQRSIMDPGEGWTLHHHENGSVGYVPSSLNNTIPHSGGASIIDTELY